MGDTAKSDAEETEAIDGIDVESTPVVVLGALVSPAVAAAVSLRLARSWRSGGAGGGTKQWRYNADQPA